MGNNKEAEANNEVDDSRPPPYEEINNVDEFGLGGSSIRPSAPKLNQTHSTSIDSPQSPSNSITGPINFNQRKDAGDNFQNEFFKKPPKFLLYPSNPSQGDGVVEERGSEFDKFPEHSERFSNMNQHQNQQFVNHPITAAPQVTASPQVQQTGINDGLTMSASQLPQQVNFPVQTCIVDNYLPRYSHKMVCPNCKVGVHSVVQYVSGQLTHLIALAACWFTCCLACVPYFIDELKDAEHFCPQCRTILGYNRKKLF